MNRVHCYCVHHITERLSSATNVVQHHGMKMVGVREAQQKFSLLLHRVGRGEEFIITKRGIPVAQLVPIQPRAGKRPLGFYRGQIEMADDFDGPMSEELQALFEGREPAEHKK